MPKNGLSKFILVHPLRNGFVSVRPFCSSDLYAATRELIMKMGSEFRIRWSNRQLPFGNTPLNGWYEYLPTVIIKREFSYLRR